MRVGPPRINLAMFRQTAHASSIKLGLLMTLSLPGWHLQGRSRKKMRLEKNFIDCFANEFEKKFRTIANKDTCN